ncbi:hypothetical protein PAMP_021810 [Pampus punctatissimus]
MAQLQGAAPCQVRPHSSGNRGAGMGLTVLCCTCFALAPDPPRFACHSAAAESTSSLTEPPVPRKLPPGPCEACMCKNVLSKEEEDLCIKSWSLYELQPCAALVEEEDV